MLCIWSYSEIMTCKEIKVVRLRYTAINFNLTGRNLKKKMY